MSLLACYFIIGFVVWIFTIAFTLHDGKKEDFKKCFNLIGIMFVIGLWPVYWVALMHEAGRKL